MNAVRVPWSGPSFLAYLGGLTVFGAAVALLVVEEGAHGAAGLVLAAVLVLAAATLLAWTAAKSGHLVTGGLLSLTSVAALVALVGALLDWFGWLGDLDSPFGGFRISILVVEVAAVAAAAVALRIFRFPLLVLVLAGATWFFVTDLLSNGGDGSAAVTILVGVALLLAGLALDSGDARTNGFWVHVVAGLTLGGGLLWFFHGGDGDWILVGLAGLAYVAFGDLVLRSSWIVLGAWGLLQTTAHFGDKWADLTAFFYLFPFAATNFEGLGEPHKHPWLAPLVFAVLGAGFIALAILLGRRRREAVPGAALL